MAMIILKGRKKISKKRFWQEKVCLKKKNRRGERKEKGKGTDGRSPSNHSTTRRGGYKGIPELLEDIRGDV